MSTITRFVERIRKESRGRSKTLTLTMEEAQDLANELTLLTLRENELLKEISTLKSANQVTQVVLGGGSFRD